jgi:hypothetical protein
LTERGDFFVAGLSKYLSGPAKRDAKVTPHQVTLRLDMGADSRMSL